MSDLVGNLNCCLLFCFFFFTRRLNPTNLTSSSECKINNVQDYSIFVICRQQNELILFVQVKVIQENVGQICWNCHIGQSTIHCAVVKE